LVPSSTQASLQRSCRVGVQFSSHRHFDGSRRQLSRVDRFDNSRPVHARWTARPADCLCKAPSPAFSPPRQRPTLSPSADVQRSRLAPTFSADVVASDGRNSVARLQNRASCDRSGAAAARHRAQRGGVALDTPSWVTTAHRSHFRARQRSGRSRSPTNDRARATSSVEFARVPSPRVALQLTRTQPSRPEHREATRGG
jgi:hypothetical protein